jgi:hypothetical protein
MKKRRKAGNKGERKEMRNERNKKLGRKKRK